MLADLRADLQRYTGLVNEPISKLRLWRSLLETQGVWALTMYRFGRWANDEAPVPLRKPAKAAYLVGFKLVEIMAGVSLPSHARIGKGLYIGHFGNIIVHPDTVMGERCSLSQGVTIGVLGGERQGVPHFGNDVYIGAGAKILGGVTVGDGAVIGANAVVIHDVPAGATAVGVPARNIMKETEKEKGSQLSAVSSQPETRTGT
ncbi:MAG: serine acetyltransferase [Myxococcales bacterium]|nr:serine acetyltransferase [Myxococcales bacterium]